LLELVGVKKITSVPYRHQGNGIVERANYEVVKQLRTMMLNPEIRHRWSMLLPRVQ